MIKISVTNVFLICCAIVSVPSAFSETYFELFSGVWPHEHDWQFFTMTFQHGAKGQPLAVLIHFFLNMVLLVACGRIVEPILGTAKFLLLIFSAWIGYIMVQWISGIWINGSSGVIWALSPFLLLPVKWAKVNNSDQEETGQAKLLLFVMWGVVTVAMGFVPLIFNPNHSLLYTFFYGNLFHATATTVGFLYYFTWRKSYAAY